MNFILIWVFHLTAVPSKFRFSSVSSTPQSERFQESHPVRHSSVSPTQFPQTLPPPPDLRLTPNPVITSRGQPKPFDNIDIAKVFTTFYTIKKLYFIVFLSLSSL